MKISKINLKLRDHNVTPLCFLNFLDKWLSMWYPKFKFTLESKYGIKFWFNRSRTYSFFEYHNVKAIIFAVDFSSNFSRNIFRNLLYNKSAIQKVDQ